MTVFRLILILALALVAASASAVSHGSLRPGSKGF